MLQFLKRRSSAKMPEGQESSSPLSKSLSALAVPGMYLFCKYNEFKRHQQEISRKKVTERELDHLNHKIAFDMKTLDHTCLHPLYNNHTRNLRFTKQAR
ncbi:hypothetical protein DPMN_063028 [Dreissena polymorpha]|uniref:Uncharacterized protein n=1 Tax=Dreissena polymorpha TaxID=45954 RepID=A0A9D4CAX8_DREPO|nr:hypothetical protein DPMN_063028 [Dreissena polymorpha]